MTTTDMELSWNLLKLEILNTFEVYYRPTYQLGITDYKVCRPITL